MCCRFVQLPVIYFGQPGLADIAPGLAEILPRTTRAEKNRVLDPKRKTCTHSGIERRQDAR